MTAVSMTIGRWRPVSARKHPDEDADEAGAEEFLGGEGLLSLRTNTKRL